MQAAAKERPTMTSSPLRRRLRRFAWTAVATLGFATVTAFVAPSPASAAFQPVTIVTSVNGVAGAPAYTGAATTVSFAVTNRSTTGAKLDLFSIVLPPGLTGVTKAGVVGPGNWNETLLRCGAVARCSAIVLVSAGLPLRNSLVPPGGTVTASIKFTAPAVPTSLSFPFLGIGNGIFTASGATPTVTVISGVPVKFGVAVATPVAAGTATNVTVTPLNASNQAVPFGGGAVTFTLTAADAVATVQGSAVGTALTVPATSSAGFTLPAVFTKAQLQSVHAQSGSLAGTSNAFTVGSGPAKSLQITSIGDTSQNPPLPTPAANQTFAVAFTAFDAYGNVAKQAGVPVTLVATNGNGVLSPAGTGSTGADGTGVISAKYSVAQTGLQLQVTSPGLVSGNGTTDIVIAGDSENGSPNTPADLAAGGATADLPNGSYGPVFLTTAPCSDEDCGQGVEVTLDGTFTDPTPNTPEPNHLYSDDNPALVTWTCPDQQCPHPDPEPPGESYTGGGVDDQEQAEDYYAYPIQVALKGSDGEYGEFQTAPPCRDLSDEKQIGDTGEITGAAQQVGFCVDVYAISRSNDDSFTGDLTLPVLFVEDPKLRPS
jgi:hypothetical protein